MPANIEIKARMVKPFDEMRNLANSAADPPNSGPFTVIDQEDTFFRAFTGRLKLRQEADRSTLISYERSDKFGPKMSKYTKIPISNPDDIKTVLGISLGIVGQVKKNREVYLVKNDGISTRIHLDSVQGLGSFIEFEVMLDSESQIEQGEKIALKLKNYFQIEDSQLISTSYMDLLNVQ